MHLERNFVRYYFGGVFVLTLIIHLYISSIGWNHALADVHGFRQTQTAISTYFMLRNGFSLQYETPVLGAPWSIPFELPLFQAIVASVASIVPLGLDQVGRLVSLAFFYASLVVCFFLLRGFALSRSHSLLVISLILASPVYLFWSRTFLIESLALLLGLLFFLLVMRLEKTSSLPSAVILVLVGSLATTVKITTAILYFIAAFSWYALEVIHKRKTIFYRPLLFLSASVFLFGIPLVVSAAWTFYADSVKDANPLARDFITSRYLTYWNFGDLDLRLNQDTWRIIFLFTTKNITTTWWYVLGLLCLGVILGKRYRYYISCSFAAYWLGPLIFTNLYYVHDYYFYANSVFLIFALGFSLISIIDRVSHFKFGDAKYSMIWRWGVNTSIYAVGIPLCFFFLYTSYRSSYLADQQFNNDALIEMGDVIKTMTDEADVVLIYGQDWSPEIAYYAKRRALMDRSEYSLEDPKIIESLQATGKEKITAMVVYDHSSTFIAERVSFFGFYDQPVFTNGMGRLYVKERDAQTSEQIKYNLDAMIIYQGISNLVPVSVRSSRLIERQYVDEQKVLLVHAPGEIVFQVPQRSDQVTAQYGLAPGFFTNPEAATSDGVQFSIYIRYADGTEELMFSHHLQPVQIVADRKMHSVQVTKNLPCECQMILKTDPVANGFWDWSYWTGIEFR